MADIGECNLAKIPKGLARLLGEWQRLVGLRAWARDCDCGWWYGEAASVSQLAGAAWTLGGSAMEEYAWIRGAEESPARVDLAVEHNKLGLRFIAEAKQRYPDIVRMRSKTIAAAILNELGEATAQLDGVPKDDWDRVAIVFLSPRVKVPEQVPSATQKFQALLRTLPHAAIWTFPRWARALRSDRTGYCYPGAALIAEHRPAPVRRARR